MDLVSYSTPEPAYTALIKAFQATKAGKGVTVTTSFGPSGTQATDVVAGQPAGVVNFSTALDMDKLVKAGLVVVELDKDAHQGDGDQLDRVLHRAQGEPRAHQDVGRPDQDGGAGRSPPTRSAPAAPSGTSWPPTGRRLAQGKSQAAGNAYLTKLLKNTVAQPTSASQALQTFLSGQGDVLLDYEDDALYAKRQGEPISIVTPPQSILIQNPIAVTKSASDPAAAKAFMAYLLSPAGQKVWGQQGYRPVLPKVAAQFTFPQPKKLFTVTSLGGWTVVNKKFFTATTGIVAKIEQGLGVSTSKSG